MKRILFIGDSIAAGREAGTGVDAGWIEILEIPPSLAQGVSGSTARHWAENVGGCLGHAYKTVADVVVVSLLANDFRLAISDDAISTAEVRAAVRDLRKVISSFLEEVRIIVILYADPFCGNNPKSAIAVHLLNELIRVTCEEFSEVEFFDCGEWLSNDEANFDGVDIHPTHDGYKVLAARLLSQVEPGGAERCSWRSCIEDLEKLRQERDELSNQNIILRDERDEAVEKLKVRRKKL